MLKKTLKLIPCLFLLFFLSQIVETQNFASLQINSAQAMEPSPVYRFWSELNRTHFYTLSEVEKNIIASQFSETQWQLEGSGFQGYAISDNPHLLPVYRFWSPQNQSHFFTISETEKNNVILTYSPTEWTYEGIVFYTYIGALPDTTPVYRFWSPSNQAHFFTTSPGERECITNQFSDNEWTYEGIAWYAPTAAADVSSADSYCGLNYGPEITVGLTEYNRSYLRDHDFEISANLSFAVKDANGTVLTTVPAGEEINVNYHTDGSFITDGTTPDNLIVANEIRFEATSSAESLSIIFDINRPSTSFDQYRGKMKLRYYDSEEADGDRIWVINTIPLEHYVWGMGEITGTGDEEYNKVMTTAFRTYGYWKILYSTRYAAYGFKVNATPGNQIYYGYDWEIAYPRIKTAAQATRGKVVMYNNEIALTPYSSWTDGRTRSFEERWGSTLYPHCQSVLDPYGQHPTKSTATLESEGNHMVGISANGALTLATDHNWTWEQIINYYYTNVTITEAY